MRTDTIVKREGMDALISNLGYVDAEQFIVLMSRELFDYTKWREEHLDIRVSKVMKTKAFYFQFFKSSLHAVR